jgi:hypothetical protein
MLLVDAHSDVEARDRINGWTVLHVAVRGGHLDLVEYLLAAQADPNGLDGMGGTPLHTAARHGFSQAVMPLASGGAALDAARSKDGYTAMHVACRHSRDTATVEALLSARADPTLPSRAGYPPAYLAAAHGDARARDLVAARHRALILKNPDGPGLSRIRDGGQYTVRAGYEHGLARLCAAVAAPDPATGLWYDPRAGLVEEMELPDIGRAAVEEGVPRLGWVAAGPLEEDAVAAELEREERAGRELFRAKVGHFTAAEEADGMVADEVRGLGRVAAAGNRSWRRARDALLAFEFAAAAPGFAEAAAHLRGCWWGEAAAAVAARLAEEAAALAARRRRADECMAEGDTLRVRYQFPAAREPYREAGPLFRGYGDAARALECAARLAETERKTLEQAAADAAVADARRLVTERAATGGEDPPRRLTLAEAAEQLRFARGTYRGYGDAAAAAAAENRLTAAEWNLERQAGPDARRAACAVIGFVMAVIGMIIVAMVGVMKSMTLL